jgi:hypothetical protein
VTTTDRTKGQIIRISHTDGKVVVEPEDEDRFVMTAQSAVQACQESHHREEAIRTFKEEFLNPLYEWCLGHSGKVKACYIAVPVSYIQVFVVGTSQRYDFGLSRELSALELKLADAGWRVSVLQLPAASAEDLQTYFSPEGAIEVYAQLAATPDQGQP